MEGNYSSLSRLEVCHLTMVSFLPYSTLQRLLDSPTVRMAEDIVGKPHVLRAPLQSTSTQFSHTQALHDAPTMIQMKR